MAIKLTLVNFRAFENKQISFEKDKLTLISGQSGAGKTTILMGIMFAFGEDYKDLIKHGKKKCKVILEIEGVKITRSKGPARLIVEQDGEVYENEEAEAVIKRTFPNIKVGYVSQQAHKYFISLKPKEQLEYIENIATNREYVDLINTNCRALINERKTKLLKAEQEQETMTKQLNELGILKPSNINFETALTQEDIKATQVLVEQAQKDHSIFQNEIIRARKIEGDLDRIKQEEKDFSPTSCFDLEEKIKVLTEQNFQWGKYVSALRKKETLKEPVLSLSEIECIITDILRLEILEKDVSRSKDAQTKLRVVNQKLQKVKLPDLGVKFSETLCYKLSEYENLVKKKGEKERLEEEINELRKKIPTSKYEFEELTRLQREKDLLQEKLMARNELERLKKLKQQQTLIYTCPCCNERIGLWKRELVKLASADTKDCSAAVVVKKDDAEKLEQEILSLSVKCEGIEMLETQLKEHENIDVKQELKLLAHNRKETKRLADKISRFTEKINTLSVQGLKELEDEVGSIYTPGIVECLKEYKDVLDELNVLTAKKAQLEERIASLDDSVKEYESIPKPEYTKKQLHGLKKEISEYEYVKKQCEELYCVEPTDDLLMYKKMLSVLRRKEQKLKELGEIVATEERCAEILEELETNKLKLKNMAEDLKTKKACESWRKVKEVAKKKKELRDDSYPRSVKLQALIKDAETKALESVVDQLNFYTQLFVERFIDELVVEFSFKTNGRIEVAAIQNGHKTNVTSLSGGEYARVALAITLAMAELHDVNLLMLDESIASLDQETTTSVLESIRANFSGTILCIAHQTVKGMFDKVVEM